MIYLLLRGKRRYEVEAVVTIFWKTSACGKCCSVSARKARLLRAHRAILPLFSRLDSQHFLTQQFSCKAQHTLKESSTFDLLRSTDFLCGFVFGFLHVLALRSARGVEALDGPSRHGVANQLLALLRHQYHGSFVSYVLA